MFTNFTSCDDQVLKQHHKELAAAVARERLARLATVGQPTALDKAASGFGVVLVRLGQRLQSHSAVGKRKQPTSLKRA
jgi:hypothetical protein